MIRASFFENKQSRWQSFTLERHADAGPYGYDLVCAAVSALTLSVINNAQRLLDIPLAVEADEVAGGFLKAGIPYDFDGGKDAELQLLLNHLYWALKDIEEEYSEHIEVKRIQT